MIGTTYQQSEVNTAFSMTEDSAWDFQAALLALEPATKEDQWAAQTTAAAGAKAISDSLRDPEEGRTTTAKLLEHTRTDHQGVRGGAACATGVVLVPVALPRASNPLEDRNMFPGSIQAHDALTTNAEQGLWRAGIFSRT